MLEAHTDMILRHLPAHTPRIKQWLEHSPRLHGLFAGREQALIGADGIDDDLFVGVR